MRLADKTKSWGKRDSRVSRKTCVGCGLEVGFGAQHAGGCPIRYPGSQPGILYLPAQACQLVGVSRQALMPMVQRYKYKVPRGDDPPFVEFEGRLWVEKVAFSKWMAMYRPRWLLALQGVVEGEACPHCQKVGSRTAHAPGCPGRISLAKLQELKKREGHCGSCGRGPDEMKKPWNFGYKTCRKCRSADRKRNADRRGARDGMAAPLRTKRGRPRKVVSVDRVEA